jgi:glycosyltransferase involved in cell wall biosynthesis
MPALNEEEALAASVENVLAGFSRFLINGELIIVDDGSSDRTGEIAECLAAKHDVIKVVHHAVPEGIGSAYRDGVKIASGDMVVYIPGDGENDAAEIFRYISLMDKVDIVIPYTTNNHTRPWHRRCLSSLYHLIMSRTFAVSVKYMNGNIIYRRAILEGVTCKSSGFFSQAEMLINVLRHGYRYAEVPYQNRVRLGGQSKSISLSEIAATVIGYAGMVRDYYFSRKDFSRLSPESVTAQKQCGQVGNCTCQ